MGTVIFVTLDESSKSERSTRIRSRVDPAMIQRIKAIVVQNGKDHGKYSTIPDASKSCVSLKEYWLKETVEKRIFSPEMNHRESQKMVSVQSNDGARKMVTVRAKLMKKVNLQSMLHQ